MARGDVQLPAADADRVVRQDKPRFDRTVVGLGASNSSPSTPRPSVIAWPSMSIVSRLTSRHTTRRLSSSGPPNSRASARVL